MGAAIGLALPQVASTLERAILPVLALLLFATFSGVPLVEVGRALRDARFLVTVLVANFVISPLAVVTQTLVELVAMVVLVRVVPLVLPDPPSTGTTSSRQ